jgi:hypothetical protein
MEAAVARVDVIREVRIQIDNEGGMKSIEPRTRLSHRRSRFSSVSKCSMRRTTTPNPKVQTGLFEPERRDSGSWAVLPHNSLLRPRRESGFTVQPGQYSTTLWREGIIFSWCRTRRSKFGSEQRTSSSHRCARQEIHLLRTPSSPEKRVSEGSRSGEFPNRRDRGKEEAFAEQ